ncbi:uncharacterized protein LOC126894932 [Daktulosphaira vitifoliae]|uniref:uncharacterized protein LOC126894932 n=1 Tax=Daktulosphaira vitifoliae TaxID=58002 RepID=UPI0021AA6681|nr:uncharacterized protein LOC126894932 [Daktulosphaira vitifoliae]
MLMARLTEHFERLEACTANISEIVIIYQSGIMAELSIPLSDESVGEREFLTLLITLYRDHPELWKLRSTDFFNKNKKAKALQTILDTLKPYKSDITVEKLKQKIKILYTNFNKCYKAIENKKRSGVLVDDILDPTYDITTNCCVSRTRSIAVTQTSEVGKHQMFTYLLMCILT